MTTAPRESWEALQRRDPAGVSPARDSLAEMVMRATIAGDGKALLDWLRSITIEARTRPGAPEAELREMEARRQLVSEIERLRDEGREAATRRSKTRT